MCLVWCILYRVCNYTVLCLLHPVYRDCYGMILRDSMRYNGILRYPTVYYGILRYIAGCSLPTGYGILWGGGHMSFESGSVYMAGFGIHCGSAYGCDRTSAIDFGKRWFAPNLKQTSFKAGQNQTKNENPIYSGSSVYSLPSGWIPARSMLGN